MLNSKMIWRYVKLEQQSMLHHRKCPLFYLWSLLWCQGHTKCCPVPSTSCHLAMHLQSLEVATSNSLGDTFTRKYIIWPWRQTKCCPVPSTSCDLCTCVSLEVTTSICLGEMHLQENALYYLDLGVKVTQNVTQHSLYHVTYAPAKFETASSNSLGVDILQENTLLPSTLHIMWPMHLWSL